MRNFAWPSRPRMGSPRLAGAIEGLLIWILPRYPSSQPRSGVTWSGSPQSMGRSPVRSGTLSILPEQGSLAGGGVFREGQRPEEQIFMGDGSLYRIIANLPATAIPFLCVRHTAGWPGYGNDHRKAARDIIEGAGGPHRAKRIDRWLGGGYLNGDKAAWRWDRLSTQLVLG